MNALQALSLNVLTQDLMLNHLMSATIDPDMQLERELNTASRAETPTAELITFLESRCRAYELLQTTQPLKTGTATSRPIHSAGTNVNKPVYCNVATQLQCPICNGSHRLFHCDKYLKMQEKQRFNYAKISPI